MTRKTRTMCSSDLSTSIRATASILAPVAVPTTTGELGPTWSMCASTPRVLGLLANPFMLAPAHHALHRRLTIDLWTLPHRVHILDLATRPLRGTRCENVVLRCGACVVGPDPGDLRARKKLSHKERVQCCQRVSRGWRQTPLPSTRSVSASQPRGSLGWLLGRRFSPLPFPVICLVPFLVSKALCPRRLSPSARARVLGSNA